MTLPDTPVIASRRSSVVAACFATLPRRLLLLAGFTVLGWFALALFGATHASAAPTSGHSATKSSSSSDADVQLPLVSIPVSPPSVAHSHSDPLTDTVSAVVAPVRPVLDSLTHALTPVTAPLARALPKPSPRTAAPMPSLSDATATLLNDTRTALTPHQSGPPSLDPRLLLALKDLFGGGSHAIPVPPTSHDHTPISAPAASGSTSAMPRVSNADVSGQPRSPSPARPADESLSTTPAPASASHGQLAGPGIPAPLPTLPPVGPDVVCGAVAGAEARAGSSTAGGGRA
ncbi:MAG TPA: hypothetical protein VGL21_13930, partial [Jatrophihabitantaceae bacterium]